MFSDTLIRWVNNISPQLTSRAVRAIAHPLFARQINLPLNTAGLTLKSGGSAIVKSGAADCYVLANAILQKITAATDMAALSGTVVNATFNCFCFFIDSAGTVTSQMGTAGATLALMVFPPFSNSKALIGFVIINPTGTGNFVGGTTALDDGTVTPNAVYINPTAGFDPQCLPGF